MISTGVGITLVTAGAILRFAVPATFIRALNVNFVGVIVMLAGVFGILLSLLVWGPLSRRHNHSGGYGSGAAPLSRAAACLPGSAAGGRPVAAVTTP